MTVLLSFLISYFAISPTLSEPLSITAQADRTTVSEDESISLKINIESESRIGGVDDITIDAPDFEELNSFQRSFTQSVYENGRFKMSTTYGVTKVLRPKRKGQLKISGIVATIEGKTHRAPDVEINVVAASQSAPSHGRQTLGDSETESRPKDSTSFFLRAEANKKEVFKGEQLIISYYLYRKVKVFNINVTKFPQLEGFLRQDMETPVIQRQLPSEDVVITGTRYKRSLLARYAAYPVKSGNLKVDALAVKLNYYSNEGPGAGIPGFDDEDDQFFQFFRQLTPSTASRESPPITIDVKPLPTIGAPEHFNGLVGQFEMTGAVDRYDVKVGEPVTVVLKIEGRGNVEAIEDPKLDLPADVELYESKGKTKPGNGAIAEKIVEYLLIPRKSGRIEIPGTSVAYFDPISRQYKTMRTEPITLNVSGEAIGTQPLAGLDKKPGEPALSPGSKSKVEPKAFKMPEIQGTQLLNTVLYGLIGLAIFSFVVLAFVLAKKRFGADWTAKRKSKASVQADSKKWDRLRAKANAALASGNKEQVASVYRALSDEVFDAVDRYSGVGARSLSRTDLGRLLVNECHLSPEIWTALEAVLERSEAVRFSSVGDFTQNLGNEVDRARDLIEKMNAKKTTVN